MTAPNAKDVERVFSIVHDQALKVERAEERLRKERERLEDRIAEAVTTEPTSVTWYAHPGTLTLEQAAGASMLTELGVHRAMERQRPRAKEAQRKERERQARARKRANRGRRDRGPDPQEPIGF